MTSSDHNILEGQGKLKLRKSTAITGFRKQIMRGFSFSIVLLGSPAIGMSRVRVESLIQSGVRESVTDESSLINPVELGGAGALAL